MPRTNKSKFALLALLSMGPRSGYDIQRDIRRTIGHFWSESYGQIYPSLKRIVELGLATVHKEPQDGKPDRKVYTITKKGSLALAEWLETPPEPPPVRNEILLKLFVGWQTSCDTLIAHLQGLANQFSAELKQLSVIERFVRDQMEKNPDAVYWLMTLRSGELYTKARLQWCEETLAILADLKKKRPKSGGAAGRSRRMSKFLESSIKNLYSE